MDPNACLKRIINAAADNDREEYAAACEDLAEWLEYGGFPPTVPKGTRHIPGNGTQWSLSSPAPDVPGWRLVYWGLDGCADKSFRLEGV